MTIPVWISLGSNLGDRRAILDEALVRLGQTPGVAVSTVSSYRETKPVGGPVGQGAFLNAAARLETSLSPRELLAATQAIEAQLGRIRTVRWGERTLDLDLLIFGEELVEQIELILPHPRLAVRRFVLEPLAEIDPDLIDPRTGMKIVNLLANLNRLPHRLLVDESIQTRVPYLFRRLSDQLSTTTSESWDVTSIDLEYWKYLSESSPSNESKPTVGDEQGAGWNDWLVKIYRPTLIVAMPLRWRARLWKHYRVPIYQPESTESESIVTEIVAVCLGVEEV